MTMKLPQIVGVSFILLACFTNKVNSQRQQPNLGPRQLLDAIVPKGRDSREDNRHRKLQDDGGVPPQEDAPPVPREPKIKAGTESGYDTGGDEPLCWSSEFSTADFDSDNITNHMERLNEEFFELANAVNLLPSCYNGTNLTVNPLNLGPNSEMLLGVPYTFRLELQMDLSVVNEDISVDQLNGVTTMHFRLHFCDALQQGPCNPLRDTRGSDATLTREQSDMDGGSGLEEFSDDEDKWAYEQGTALLGLTDAEDSTEIYYGRWCKWSFREVPGNTNVFRAGVNITLQLPERRVEAGRKPYYFVGHAVVDFELGNELVQRVDISQMAQNRVVYVKPQPTILTVTTGAKIALGVIIAIFGLLAAFCFIVIVANREHPVMRLAQGSFLAAIAAACFLQTGFSFTYIPGDKFCNMRGPLVQVPITFW
jgi:hypothetical protein